MAGGAPALDKVGGGLSQDTMRLEGAMAPAMSREGHGTQWRAQRGQSPEGRKELGALDKEGVRLVRAERWQERWWDIKAPFRDKSSPTFLRERNKPHCDQRPSSPPSSTQMPSSHTLPAHQASRTEKSPACLPISWSRPLPLMTRMVMTPPRGMSSGELTGLGLGGLGVDLSQFLGG